MTDAITTSPRERFFNQTFYNTEHNSRFDSLCFHENISCLMILIRHTHYMNRNQFFDCFQSFVLGQMTGNRYFIR